MMNKTKYILTVILLITCTCFVFIIPSLYFKNKDISMEENSTIVQLGINTKKEALSSEEAYRLINSGNSIHLSLNGDSIHKSEVEQLTVNSLKNLVESYEKNSALGYSVNTFISDLSPVQFDYSAVSIINKIDDNISSVTLLYVTIDNNENGSSLFAELNYSTGTIYSLSIIGYSVISEEYNNTYLASLDEEEYRIAESYNDTEKIIEFFSGYWDIKEEYVRINEYENSFVILFEIYDIFENSTYEGDAEYIVGDSYENAER